MALAWAVEPSPVSLPEGQARPDAEVLLPSPVVVVAPPGSEPQADRPKAARETTAEAAATRPATRRFVIMCVLLQTRRAPRALKVSVTGALRMTRAPAL